MDQALKSALEKYNGKVGVAAPIDKSSLVNKIAMGIAVVIAIVLVFSVCVRYDFLGAGQVWLWIENIGVGDQTVGTLIDGVENQITSVFSQSQEKTTAPINENGESGNMGSDAS